MLSEGRKVKLTEADAKSWHMRESAHYNGGKVFFAYMHRCVEQPRLTRYDRYERKDRSVTSTWRTDGVDKDSLAAAVDALNDAPQFTPDELAMLITLPHEYEPDNDIRKGLDWTIMTRLKDKGAVEWEKGRCRTTELGRTAIKEAGNG